MARARHYAAPQSTRLCFKVDRCTNSLKINAFGTNIDRRRVTSIHSCADIATATTKPSLPLRGAALLVNLFCKLRSNRNSSRTIHIPNTTATRGNQCGGEPIEIVLAQMVHPWIIGIRTRV